jgi:hypothetical protein
MIAWYTFLRHPSKRDAFFLLMNSQGETVI